jgi:NAD(P)-dependent dehydrogenase (short-subunit alcohol dehydrogenase family)
VLLKDRVALISGGAKGMGRGMAERFAAEGCKVAIADIAADEGKKVEAAIKSKGGEGMALTCDVTDINNVKETVEKVIDAYGKIDILVNNAGAIAQHKNIEDLTEEEWDRVMALNLKSHFFFCKFVVPHMKKANYGRIIGVSSIGAIQPPAHEIHYNSAKSGIIGFTYDLGKALAPMRITVNAILPGPIRTEFYEKHTKQMSDQEKDKFFNEGLGKKTPMQRSGTPEDIAGVVLFLASELGAFVTCETINVGGGLPQQP